MAAKKVSATPSSPKMDGGYLKAYVQLRTALDATEIAAIRYFLEGETAAERNRRAAEITEKLKFGLGKGNAGGRDSESQCPPGFNDCGGYCVPYQCMD